MRHAYGVIYLFYVRTPRLSPVWKDESGKCAIGGTVQQEDIKTPAVRSFGHQ